LDGHRLDQDRRSIANNHGTRFDFFCLHSPSLESRLQPVCGECRLKPGLQHSSLNKTT
jgi:hypothetical protein